MPSLGKMRKRERVEADEELRGQRTFLGASFEEAILRSGGEVSAAFSRQNGAVVCGSR